MSKEFSFPNSGTCSKQTNFVLNDDHTIASMEVIGGCNGNLKGICRLVKGMKAEDVIDRMEGTLCGFRNTSCPDQIAKNLKKALAEMDGKIKQRRGDACGYLLFVFPSRQKEMFFFCASGLYFL